MHAALITNIEETARVATVSDVGLLAAMAAAGIGEQVDARGGAMASALEFRSLPADDELNAAVANPDYLVLVGEFDGAGVGYSVTHLLPLRDGSILARIEDLYVDPEAREMGVGEAMIRAISEWARAQGCRGMDSLALPGNRATKNFFETFGLKARSLTVHKDLTSE